MKLYTEEEVKQMLIKTDKFTPLHIEYIMNEITPIEIPSDEDIEINPFVFGNKHLENIDMDIWELGAKWMRDKIQGGNK